MILAFALGWLLGIGAAIILLQFAAAALADRDLEQLRDQPEARRLEWGGLAARRRRRG